MYGKTIQNVRGYINVKVHTDKDHLLDAITDPNLKRCIILGENLVQTNHDVPVIKHRQPIIIGFTILELVNCFSYLIFSIIVLISLKLTKQKSLLN